MNPKVHWTYWASPEEDVEWVRNSLHDCAPVPMIAPPWSGFPAKAIELKQTTNKNEPSPWAKAQGFRSADMIWLNYRRCSLTYRRMTCSSIFPTVSAKYPSAQKLSPHRNSSNSGYSFLITRLVPPFNLCTTSATLSVGFVWMIRWTWSSWILSSLAHHLFIRHASYNNPFRRTTILPRSTRRRYFGIQTTWYCRRCFVWAPVWYLAMPDHVGICSASPGSTWRSFERMPFIPRLKSLGVSGIFAKTNDESFWSYIKKGIQKKSLTSAFRMSGFRNLFPLLPPQSKREWLISKEKLPLYAFVVFLNFINSQHQKLAKFFSV